MKPITIITSLLLAPALTTAQLLVPLNRPPVGQLPVMAPPKSADDAQQRPAVPLADILGTNRALTSFSSFTRMHASSTDLLGDLDTNTTVLAPLNSAIESLPRKPWEATGDYDALGADAYSGDDGKDRAQQNLRRFVQAHLVAASPWEKDEKAKTVSGREVWWTEKGGKRVVMPDEVEVDRVASKVANGEVVSNIFYMSGSVTLSW